MQICALTLLSLLFFAITSNAQQPAFLTNGLVAWYRFDGDWKDRAQINGDVLNPDLLQFGPDRFGNPRSSFAPQDNLRAYIPTGALPSGTRDRTLAMWVNTGDPSLLGLRTLWFAGASDFNRAWIVHVTGIGVTDQGGPEC